MSIIRTITVGAPASRLRRAIVVAVTGLVTAGTIAPAGGGVLAEPSVPGPGGDVSATFRPKAAPGPCITISGPSTVGFGQLAFGDGFGAGSTTTVVASCAPSGVDQDLLASVSDATGTSGAARWTPFDCGSNPPAACVTPANQFAYLLAGFSLTGTPRVIGPPGDVDHRLRLPAPGSTGGGEVVRMTVTILGVLR